MHRVAGSGAQKRLLKKPIALYLDEPEGEVLTGQLAVRLTKAEHISDIRRLRPPVAVRQNVRRSVQHNWCLDLVPACRARVGRQRKAKYWLSSTASPAYSLGQMKELSIERLQHGKGLVDSRQPPCMVTHKFGDIGRPRS